MKIFRNINEIEYNKNTIVTIGTFDGFHIGHQNIVNKVVNAAKEIGGRSFLVTFDPHPRSVVSENYDLKLITTLDEKLELFEKSGIENLLIINFTPEFSQLSSEEFFENYILKIGISQLIIGHDHRLGKDRDAGEKKIKELGIKNGFEVFPVSAVNIEDETVSSTKIRKALLEGKIETANKFLNRNYSISGTVVQGAMRGRTLGYPTANIQPHNSKKIFPSNGIYFVEAEVESEKFFGLMNIGLRPTFADISEPIIEVYLLDFSKMIYGKSVQINVIKKMRNEIKFDSIEKLIEQMDKDKLEAQIIIENLNKNFN